MVIQLYFKNHVKTLRKAKMDFLDCCYIIDGTGLTLHVAGLLDWLLLSFCLFLASYKCICRATPHLFLQFLQLTFNCLRMDLPHF